MKNTYQNKQQQIASQQVQQAQQNLSYEKTVPFSQARAIIWQVKFALNNVNSKKAMASALSEIQNLSDHYGKEFDKYVLKELIEMIDLKDAIKSQKDKNEVQNLTQILSQELTRTSQKPEFLQYFTEIAQPIYDHRIGDFLNDLNKKLKLSFNLQLLIALSLYESSKEDMQQEALKIFKQKLGELNLAQVNKLEGLPEYSIHQILFILQTHPDMRNDELMQTIFHKISDTFPLKTSTNFALKESLNSGIQSSNAGNPLLDETSLSFLKEGNGLDFLDKTNKVLEPWQVLLDLGPQATNDYNGMLVNIFSDFKEISEKTMARTLLQLALNHNCYLDQTQRMVSALYDECKKQPEEKKKEEGKKTQENVKKGPAGKAQQQKESAEKKTQVATWNIENLSRLFRELYSGLNWNKVFEALTDIDDEITLDYKCFQVFLQLFNKCKPQNILFPLNIVLEQRWLNPALQINFIENCIQTYLDKKDKSINFLRVSKRQEIIDEIQGYKDKVQVEMMHIWLCIDLSERLIELSQSSQFHKVRSIFEQPLKTLPDYLLLVLSHTKPIKGNLMMDELLSLLLPQFLGNHINSIPVLQQLWKYNQQLMIRGICELCRHDQRIMNLSRVLDITQEVKESLLPIVDCDDYYFAVNLGILAGKRDFLHYDVWLQGRIQQIGTPFIKALLKYIKDHIITPINEYLRRQQDINADQFEQFKNNILDKSHLSKEKLCLTLEHLQNPINYQNPKIKQETLEKIKDVCLRTAELFPSQMQPTQNSEEIDNAANEYFQRVFSAQPDQVDQKISELIDIMRKFKESEVKTQQEIYACMLHSLFDEYRFLHRYPQQYLEKIAKLFGQIIKNKIIEGTLHEIALKFAYEAFRREGRRQKFGVIVIKQFFDMLPLFPSFFKDIYEIRNNLAQTEPQMLQDLEQLWQQSKIEEQQKQALAEQEENKEHLSEAQKKSNKKDSATAQQKEEELKQANQQKGDKKLSSQSANLDLSSAMFTKFGGKNKLGAIVDQEDQSQDQPKFIHPSEIKPQTNLKAPFQQQDIPRTSTPNLNLVSQTFIPSFKQNQLTNSSGPPQSESGLKVSSAAFNRGGAGTTQQPSTFQNQTPSFLSTNSGQVASQGLGAGAQSTQMNTGVAIFTPSNMRGSLSSQAPAFNFTNAQQQTQLSESSRQMQGFMEQMNLKMQKAIFDNTKLRFDDIIEDPNYVANGPPLETQEAIKKICNNVVKSNLQQKLEELKNLLAGPNQIQNLQWFIHYIITKRVASSGGQNLYPVYIDLIRQIGIRQSVELTIQQLIECFKKCLVIDEEQFYKVIQKAPQQANPIKSFLMNIGIFMGQLTLSNNRPILAKELDFKQLLIEAYQQDKLKYVVTFVCRVLKEGTKSFIFKITNPWINGLFSLLKEIRDNQLQLQTQISNEISNEVESLFKAYQLNAPYVEIQNNGILRALNTQQFQNQSQQIELNYLMSKANLLLPQIVSQYNRLSSASPAPSFNNNVNLRALAGLNNVYNLQPAQQQQQQQQQTQQELIAQQQQQQQLQQQQQQQILEKVKISNELLLSINKLMQQSEAQIKKLIAEAVDSSIEEIQPPVVDRSVTIALITTRELVIKDFAYDGDPQKILKAADLIVKNLAGSLALVTCREPLKMSLTTNLRKSLTVLYQQSNQNIEQTQENQIQEIAQLAGKENLELGCKLIKKAVIEKAQKKVVEEPFIAKAIEMRQQAQEQKLPFFRDEAAIAMMTELPPQLQPSPHGLSEAQFQVYEDFSRLQLSQKKQQQEQESVPNHIQIQQLQQQQFYEQADCDTLLKAIETNGLTLPLKNVLTNRIRDLNNDKSSNGTADEEKNRIEQYCQKWLLVVCQRFDETNSTKDIQPLIDTLSIVSQTATFGDLQQKLTRQFLSLNESQVLNIDLNMILLKYRILPIGEWDKQLADFVNSSIPLSKVLCKFLSTFLKTTVMEMKLFPYHQVSHLMEVIEKISSNKDVGEYFTMILEDYKKKPNASQQQQAKEYFNEWVIINYTESNNQEQVINNYFKELTQSEFITDSEMMSSFCKVLVETCVEKALYMNNGQKRPSDRLDYRYIDCFIKLVIVLMKTSQFNKHKFMIKLFESLQETLDEEHRVKKHEFNQKPFYRILLKMLTMVNVPQCYNYQTQQLVLSSLADLFNKLNPNKYPAFAFSWIELISHKNFMPYFLQPNLNKNAGGSQQQVSQQNAKKGASQSQASGFNDPSNTDTYFYDKYFKYKELIVNLFTFLKQNMSPNQPTPPALVAFYQATLRVCLVILNDFPEFFCDFHFNFVNSLPENFIQLRNIILSAYPQHIQPPNPFQRQLKVDLLAEVQSQPRILSNYENYLQIMNLREDLESYIRTKNSALISAICEKMMSSEEIINGKKKINGNVINAVVLFIANQSCSKQNSQQVPEITNKESMELFKAMVYQLNNETRWLFLNSIINELRYPNNHTYYFSCIILFLFVESQHEIIQEQIARILFERLQVNRPHPWGLMISFRELIQNPKYGFMKKNFISQNQAAIDQLFATRLEHFKPFLPKAAQSDNLKK